MHAPFKFKITCAGCGFVVAAERGTKATAIEQARKIANALGFRLKRGEPLCPHCSRLTRDELAERIAERKRQQDAIAVGADHALAQGVA